MILDPKVFKDYDIRAIIPQQLDESGLIRIAQAIIAYFKPKTIQIGRDMRLTSLKFSQILIKEFLTAGIDVTDLGLISTDMLYFASAKYQADLSLTISASHNPAQYNGLKIVTKGAIPVSGQTGIYQIKNLALSDKNLSVQAVSLGKLTKLELMPEWINHVLSFINLTNLKPFKIVIDAGNGMAGFFMPQFASKLPFKIIPLYFELDGSFPHHVPSPIESKNLVDLINQVKQNQADLGMAFDGDGDRVFLVDELGRTVSGTIMTAIIAENLLQKYPGETILYNAIVGRIVPEIIKKYHGRPVRVKVGHTLIKAAMRKENGLFCGEHSGHYYFRNNFFADSAIIAALLVLELMSLKNLKLSQLINQYNVYYALEELNFKVDNKQKIIAAFAQNFQNQAAKIDWLDGLSVWFPDWWFNLRASNTEPLLRLNLEANSPSLLEVKSNQLINQLISQGAKKL